MTNENTQPTKAPAIDMDALGLDARALASSWFGLGMKTSVTLHLIDSRPTARAQAAIDELVAKGVASVEPFNDFGGRVYRPLVDCHDAFVWMGRIMHGDGKGGEPDPALAEQVRFQLYEPIDEDQSYDLMSPFGQGVWDKEKRGRKPKDNPYDATTHPDEHARWRKGHRAGARPGGPR